MLQVLFAVETMPKKARKKLKIPESDSDTDIVEVPPMVKVKTLYEDTKAVTGVEPELKWGQIYPMMVDKKVPEDGLGDLARYENILRSRLTKIATRPEVFPCAEVIGWIFPNIYMVGMIISDEEGNPVASFAPAFISKAYSLPEVEISVTTDWVKRIKFDYTTTVKGMMAEGKKFIHKHPGEYEIACLRTPFRLITLMLSRLYGRCDGKTYNFGWILLLYYVEMEGKVFE